MRGKWIYAIVGVLVSGVIFIASHFYEETAIRESSTKAVLYEEDSKLWAHRVYHSNEANALLKEFKGVEIDVIYDQTRGVFDIRHDEDDVFYDRPLEKFFSEIEGVNEYYYWLDFKNLNNRTVKEAQKRLNYLLDKFEVRNNVIVESCNPTELGLLSKDSIFTSFWGPHFKLEELTDSDIEKEVRNLHKVLYENEINAISIHYTMVPFLEKYFSNCNVHIWTNGLTGRSGKIVIDQLHKKDFIKVILVDYKENFILE